MIFCQGVVLSIGSLVLGCCVVSAVFHLWGSLFWVGLWSRWFVFRWVCRQHGLSSGGSVVSMVCVQVGLSLA